MFKVNVGYDRQGRERNRYFADLVAACAFVGVFFRRRGIVLAIEEVSHAHR